MSREVKNKKASQIKGLRGFLERLFGQPFISNPDLVARLRNGWPLAEADGATYYGGGTHGYIDDPPYAAA